MDIVYLVRPGELNEELRWSLRSLTNLPHDRVWVAGHKPAWVTNVGHIPTTQTARKHANAYGNMRAALAHPDVSERFILFNDDFYVTAPTPHLPTLRRGRLADVIADYRSRFPHGSLYIEHMQATHDWLLEQGIPEPLSYELHAPMVMEKQPLIDLFTKAELDGVDVTRMHYRTAYGNLAGVGGDYSEDCKVYRRDTVPLPTPFASTHDGTFTYGAIGRAIRRAFTSPGCYEV